MNENIWFYVIPILNIFFPLYCKSQQEVKAHALG